MIHEDDGYIVAFAVRLTADYHDISVFSILGSMLSPQILSAKKFTCGRHLAGNFFIVFDIRNRVDRYTGGNSAEKPEYGRPVWI